MKKVALHIAFWLYVALYTFDYFIDIFGANYAMLYTGFEVSMYMVEFYLNLFLLIPFFLQKRRMLLYAFSILILLTIVFLFYNVTGLREPLLSEHYLRAVYSLILNHSLFILISGLTWYFNEYQTREKIRIQTEYEKLQAEMKLLKSQISPHFLFNTLNNIYTLALTKNEDAPKMIADLSDLLRYFIYEGNKEEVALQSEVAALERYLQLQKYRRIAGSSNISFGYAGTFEGIKVPPLIFITLVENAFKHGDLTEDPTGFVSIEISTTGKSVAFKMANSFREKTGTQGIGLSNLKSQLDIYFAKVYNLNIQKLHNVFTVSLNFDGKQ
ncbi:MAG: sensor histidine kinase [Chitinophagaceae bacterium]|nr:sensor histidine kinase [Chitinophagaceae bacterium]